MSNITKLEEMGFKINWTLLKIGYQGLDFLPKVLTIGDICDYAINKLEFLEFDYELIAQLAGMENDQYELCEVLTKLTKSEKVETIYQIRKWTVLIVKQELEKLPIEYTDGLLKLSDLWVSLGLPDYCPHIIQGRNNKYTPQEYYTQDMYDRLVHENASWIEDEIKFINLQEK